jgi:hypothetical protein
LRISWSAFCPGFFLIRARVKARSAGFSKECAGAYRCFFFGVVVGVGACVCPMRGVCDGWRSRARGRGDRTFFERAMAP